MKLAIRIPGGVTKLNELLRKGHKGKITQSGLVIFPTKIDDDDCYNIAGLEEGEFIINVSEEGSAKDEHGSQIVCGLSGKRLFAYPLRTKANFAVPISCITVRARRNCRNVKITRHTVIIKRGDRTAYIKNQQVWEGNIQNLPFEDFIPPAEAALRRANSYHPRLEYIERRNGNNGSRTIKKVYR